MKKERYLRNCYADYFATTLSVALLALPACAHAQILISEVMYDPVGSDDKQEWIELYNGGDTAVDITKWTFTDGSSSTKHGLNIPPKNGGTGSLVMQPGGYLIIADDALAFESAFPAVANVIDSTMSLPDPNVGLSATVILYDDQKNVADTFVYVSGTNADNKGDSAQRSPSGIIPAAPTPSVANATIADTTVLVSATTASTSAATQSQDAAVSSYVPPPVPTLFADAGSDRIEIVGADTAFRGRAYTRNQDAVERVRYVWNFGDGSTAEGETVLHHFSYPGKYAVTLTVAQDKNTAIDRIVATAEPARLAFVAYADGSIEIVNNAGRELDLSLWLVKSGARQFMLPEGSVVLPSASIHIPQQTLGFWSNGDTELEYPNGVTAVLAGQTIGTAGNTVSITETASQSEASLRSDTEPVERTVVAPLRTAQYRSPESVQDAYEGPVSEVVAPTSSLQTAAAGSVVPIGSPWLWGALGVAGLGAAAGAVARKHKAGEWEIEEATDTV